MRRVILSRMDFRGPTAGWTWPPKPKEAIQTVPDGCIVTATGRTAATIQGPGVHARNGDSIEIVFDLPDAGRGTMGLAFSGGMERLAAVVDLTKRRLRLETSEWTRPQPVAAGEDRIRSIALNSQFVDRSFKLSDTILFSSGV